MSNWRSLVGVYSDWRWALYKKASKNKKFMAQIERRGRFRLYCNPLQIRSEFSAYARLPQVISIKDMRKLEANFQRNG